MNKPPEVNDSSVEDTEWIEYDPRRTVLEEFEAYLSSGNYDTWWMSSEIDRFLNEKAEK